MPNLSDICSNLKYALIKLGGLLGMLCSRILFAIKTNMLLYRLFFISTLSSMILRGSLKHKDDLALALYLEDTKLLDMVRLHRARSKLKELLQETKIEITNIEELDSIDAVIKAFIKAQKAKIKSDLHKKYQTKEELQAALQRLNNSMQKVEAIVRKYITPYKAQITNPYLLKAMYYALIASSIGMLIAIPYAITAITLQSILTILKIDIILEIGFAAYIFALKRILPRLYGEAKKLDNETINNIVDLVDICSGQKTGEDVVQTLIEEPQNALFWSRQFAGNYIADKFARARSSFDEMQTLYHATLYTKSDSVSRDVNSVCLTSR